MKGILKARGVKLWIIDNLASLASGIDENSKQDWDPINQWLLELRFAGISTIMLHHVNKVGGQRGTSAREDNLDVSVILKPPKNYTPEDGARFICHFSKARVKISELQAISSCLMMRLFGFFFVTQKGLSRNMGNLAHLFVVLLEQIPNSLFQKIIERSLQVNGEFLYFFL